MTASSRITRFEGVFQKKEGARGKQYISSTVQREAPPGKQVWKCVVLVGPWAAEGSLLSGGWRETRSHRTCPALGKGCSGQPPFFCLSLSRFNTTREKVSQVTFFLTPWFCNFFMNRCGNFISNSKIWDFPRHNHCEFSGCSPPLGHKLGVLRRWWEPMRR